MLDDLHLVADGGRAIAVFTAGAERRAAMADALSWHVPRRFQAGALEAEGVVELRAAGALADRIDEHRGVEAKASIRLNVDEARVLIDAVVAYVSERDTDAYQPPEERARIAELSAVVDPLFDLVLEPARADEMLHGGAPPY